MRILLTGATGLIGSAVLARLRSEGHWVASVVRPGSRPTQSAECIPLDIARATNPEDWQPHLAGIDAIVNCAGVFQDSPRDSTAGVHVHGARALFMACEQAGVRRVIHISAIGVDRDPPTAFSRTKQAGDRDLMARDLDWVILRPSVVVGRAAYGGSALFRGLAALPIVPVLPGAGLLQIVQLDDLVRTVLFFLRPEAPVRLAIEIAGPERLTLAQVLRAYRHWLGWREARVVELPHWAAQAMFRLGDGAGLLGWRPPMRSTARLEMMRGAVGSAVEWTSITGIVPRALGAALAAEPASVQERWFARLYFTKPIALATLSLFWLITGLLTLGPSWNGSLRLTTEAGAGSLGPAAVAAGAVADILIGAGIAIRHTAKRALQAALALSGAYLVMGTILLPRLWIDPLGPLLKVLPILVLNLVALAMLDDR